MAQGPRTKLFARSFGLAAGLAASMSPWANAYATVRPQTIEVAGLAPRPALAVAPAHDPLAPLAWQRHPSVLRAQSTWRFGLAALATGSVLGVGAIVLAETSPCAARAGNSCFADARRRAVLTMALPATMLITGGTVALLLGLARWHRARPTST